VLLRQLGVAGSVAGFDALGQGVDVWQLLQAWRVGMIFQKRRIYMILNDLNIY
jgi:hypothetical protein